MLESLYNVQSSHLIGIRNVRSEGKSRFGKVVSDMSELGLQVDLSYTCCFRKVKVESRNCRNFVSEVVSSDFELAALTLTLFMFSV